jgi:PAS domain S-box-containing protein
MTSDEETVRRMDGGRIVVAWLGSLAILTSAALNAAAPSAVTRVLVLHHYGQEVAFRSTFDPAIQEALRAASSGPIEIYVETIESYRFPAAAQSGLIPNYLRQKYAGRRIDVVIAVADAAVTFARQNRDVFGKAPIVAMAPMTRVDPGEDDVTGLQGALAIRETLGLALQLLPATERVFVVDGVLQRPEHVEEEVRRQFDAIDQHVGLEFLRDLPMADLVARLKGVPDRSIVLFLRQTMWDRTTSVDQREGLAQVVAASPVPIFSLAAESLGTGSVGGYAWQVRPDATRVADLAIRVANGKNPRAIPLGQATMRPTLDWRQLRRWGIPEERIPATALVLFRDRSLFSTYRSYILAGLLIFTAQFALIGSLLVQRGRRRRAEEESRNNDELYRSVVDAQSDLICRFLPDSTLTFVNDAYCRFWKKTREELVGTRFIDLIPPASHQAVLDHIVGLRSGTDSQEHEVTLPDGTIGWHHWINHVILDPRGQVVELQGVGRDITARKRAEEALGQLEARNSAILRAIPDLMFVLHRDGTYLDFHARDPTRLLAPPSMFIGRKVRDVMPPAIAETLMDALDRACVCDDMIVVEYEITVDEPRQFEARLVNAGGDRVLSIVRDVTESKRALALNRDLAGRLIASQEAERTRIARDLHDGVCQEVASFTVDISYLRQKGSDIQSHEAQETLFSLERRAAGVAETLRLLSHGLHPTVLHHIGLVAALHAHCGEVERQHQLQVRFFADGEVEPSSPLVALALFRIAQEALRNVARHGHARYATISLERDASDLVLTVVDDGAGFDPATARQNGGLGLVSIEERARLAQGEATIDSQPGGGTRIEVRLPVEVLDDGAGVESQQQADFSRSSATGRRISLE